MSFFRHNQKNTSQIIPTLGKRFKPEVAIQQDRLFDDLNETQIEEEKFVKRPFTNIKCKKTFQNLSFDRYLNVKDCTNLRSTLFY